MKKILVLAALAGAVLVSPSIAQEKNMDMVKKWYEGVFQKQDTANEGFISRDAYMVMSTAEFLKMDTNKDGKISKTEYMSSKVSGFSDVPTQSKEKSMGMAKKWYEGVFQKQDTANEGFISRDAYMVMSTAEFLKMDKNKDGKISKVEYIDTSLDGYSQMVNQGN